MAHSLLNLFRRIPCRLAINYELFLGLTLAAQKVGSKANK